MARCSSPWATATAGVTMPRRWTTTTASFTVPAVKGEHDLFFTFSNSGDGTLPLTLSSFTAALTNENNVNLYWVTATETGVLGYYLYRSEDQALEHAGLISPLIPGTNTSNEQHYRFDDMETQASTQYYYWLEGLDIDGATAFYGPVGILTQGGLGENPPSVPLKTELIGNFPNPFNPVTILRYSLKNAAKVDFTIYNCRGQVVKRISQNHSSAGYYSLPFDARDGSGRPLASGLYFCTMEAGGYSSLRKMLLMK